MSDPQTTHSTPPSPAPAKKSLRRRILFPLVIAAGLVLFTELTCLVGLIILDGGLSFAKLHYDQDQVPPVTLKNIGGGVVFHPYLGFTYNPEANPALFRRTLTESRFPVNDYGFLDTNHPIQKRSPDKYIVGIVGGSVAWDVSADGADALTRTLKESPELHDKEIIIVRLALPAYKQPQQLMAVNYFLSLGGEFDAIVNIDGFNEVRTHILGNADTGINPTFPHAWATRMERMEDPAMIGIAYRHLASQVTRSRWARFFRNLPFRNSCTLNFIWRCRDRALQRSITEDALTLSEAAATRNKSFAVTGPHLKFDNDTRLYEYLTEFWKNCSLQLAQLCAANGIQYVHVLQPNQYFEGSKPISAEESQVAVLARREYNVPVQVGYPLMIEKGKWLKQSGVRFLDLTMLFADTTAPIYIDNCCHYNDTGNARVAEAIARELVLTPTPMSAPIPVRASSP